MPTTSGGSTTIPSFLLREATALAALLRLASRGLIQCLTRVLPEGEGGAANIIALSLSVHATAPPLVLPPPPLPPAEGVEQPKEEEEQQAAAAAQQRAATSSSSWFGFFLGEEEEGEGEQEGGEGKVDDKSASPKAGDGR